MFVPLEILPSLLYCEKYLPVALESPADVQRMRRTVSVKLQHGKLPSRNTKTDSIWIYYDCTISILQMHSNENKFKNKFFFICLKKEEGNNRNNIYNIYVYYRHSMQ